MLNPFQYFKVMGRPIGIWVGVVAVSLEFIGHLVADLVLYISLLSFILVGPLFLLAMVQLVRHRFSGMITAVAYLVVGMYAGLMLQLLGYYDNWYYVMGWWLVSLIGIAGLISNRRWYYEKLLRFP